LLEVASTILRRFELPLLLVGIDKEFSQLATIGTLALELILPGPIPGRRERQGDAAAQMFEGGRT
jgi:hypothetical protein